MPGTLLSSARFAGKVGFSPDEEYSRVGGESGKGKTTHLGICNIRSFWLQVLGFPHARPRMCRFEVGVAACILIGVLSARAPPSPRCTALTAASCENHGAAPNYGTRVPGIFGGKSARVLAGKDTRSQMEVYFGEP